MVLAGCMAWCYLWVGNPPSREKRLDKPMKEVLRFEWNEMEKLCRRFVWENPDNGAVEHIHLQLQEKIKACKNSFYTDGRAKELQVCTPTFLKRKRKQKYEKLSQIAKCNVRNLSNLVETFFVKFVNFDFSCYKNRSSYA